MIMAVVIFAVSAGLYYVFAAKQNEGGMMGSGMMHGRTMDSNDMMKDKMWQNRGMVERGGMMGMHPMYGSSLSATEDGGALVLMGNKLCKYDKDLNLVKEVEIKMDWESMNKTMMEHHKMMMGTSSGSENK
jgi:hypothetical protein